MRKFYTYGIGAALVDTEIQVSDQDLQKLNVEKGLMTLVDDAQHQALLDFLTASGHLTASSKACGGSAANTIIAQSFFGGTSCYSCRVADDENGHLYLDGLKEAGVHYAGPADLPTDGESGKCLVMITPDAERSMNTYLGASELFSVDNIDFDLIGNAEYLYIEGYLVTSATGLPAATAARHRAKEHGTKVAMSLSDPGIVEFFKTGLQQIVDGRVDLLFCNLAEAQQWTGCSSLEEAAEALKNSTDTFAITLGSEGALLFDGTDYHRIDAHPVTAVDTNGAGDMFAGAFLFGLEQGYSFKKAGELASLSAAAVVSHYGPRLHPFQHQELLAEFNQN